MRIDVATAVQRFDCTENAVRKLHQRGVVEGRYEHVLTTYGKSQRMRKVLTFDEQELADVLAGSRAGFARGGPASVRLEDQWLAMDPGERKKLEKRLDVTAAAKVHGCSEAKIRQYFRHGKLKGSKTPYRTNEGFLSVKLTFSKEDLDACFLTSRIIVRRHEAHVASIRASAKPFSERQKKAIAEVFIEHLQEKHSIKALYDNPESSEDSDRIAS